MCMLQWTFLKCHVVVTYLQGLDIPDIALVVVYGTPSTMTLLYQVYSFNTNSLIIIIHKPFTLSSFLAERDGMVPFLEHIFFTLSESRQKRI